MKGRGPSIRIGATVGTGSRAGAGGAATIGISAVFARVKAATSATFKCRTSAADCLPATRTRGEGEVTGAAVGIGAVISPEAA